MTYYDEKLKALQEKISRSRQLTSMLKELRGQRDTIAARVRELEAIKVDEQADVDRLEGRSLASFLPVMPYVANGASRSSWVLLQSCWAALATKVRKST